MGGVSFLMLKNGPYKGKRKQYLRARVLREKGDTLAEISAAIGVSPHTIAHWVNDLGVDVRKTERFRKIMIAKSGELTVAELASKPGIKKRLIAIRGHACQNCCTSTWMDRPITLELHRKVDKPYRDCIESDLELLCPNCHSLTKTWKGRGKIKDRYD